MQISKNISSCTKFIGVIFVLLSLSFKSFGAPTTVESILVEFEDYPLSRNKIHFHLGFQNYLNTSPHRYTGSDTLDEEIDTYFGMISNLSNILSDTENFERILQQHTPKKFKKHVDSEKHGKAAFKAVDKSFKALCKAFGGQPWFRDAVVDMKKKADEQYGIIA